jgi:hypothetical protein
MFDGVFNDLINDKTSSDKGITPVKQNMKSFDPRTDLGQDTILWWQMLVAALDLDPSGELYAALLYMRTRGTVLRRVHKRASMPMF